MNTTYIPVTGTVTGIVPHRDNCCMQTLSMQTDNGPMNLILSPGTYVADNIRLRRGMRVTGFYDAGQPAPLIFPPQFQASAITQTQEPEMVTLDYFERNLVSSHNTLKLNISRNTSITTGNGQTYTCSLEGKLLLVYFTVTTRSIPPQTTPSRIIVLC